jgi:hypothetical protein
MPKSFCMDTRAYDAMLSLLSNLHRTEQNGLENDVHFMLEDWWLPDTAVIENVECRKGLWEVHLVFALSHQPLQFIKRKIAASSDLKKARMMGYYMRKVAARDQRGTLSVEWKDFKTVSN